MDRQQAPATTARRRVVAVATTAVMVLAAVLLIRTMASSEDGPDSDAASRSSEPSSASPAPSASSPESPSASSSAATSDSPVPETSSPSARQSSPAATESVNPRRVAASFDETAEPLSDVSLAVTDVQAVNIKARAPGEVSGPGLRLTVRAANDTAQAVGVGTTVANLYYGPDATPATPVALSGAKPLPRSIAPGAEATGVFVFSVPKDERGRLRLEVVLGAKFRTVDFSGACPSDC